MQVAAIPEVSRTKEGRSKESLREQAFSNGLSNRRLPRPSEAVEPEDGGLVEVPSPRLDLVQNSLPCAPQAASAVAMSVCSPMSAAAAVQHRQVDYITHR